MLLSDNTIVAVVGLGYVGLPLAVEFGRVYSTIGFDLSAQRIKSCVEGSDPTGAVLPEELQAALIAGLKPTTDPSELAKADFIVVAVPTPVDNAHVPDFGPLVSASTIIGANMKRGATVIYESTVYPGATEEVCIPVLETQSSMKWMDGFNVGYSPERINPGDREHSLTRIVKVVSGDSPHTLSLVSALYSSVVTAGVHEAESISVAEAAKVIENTQRDLNIALMNELAIVFHRIGIDTQAVLRAAGTKWNFLKFTPGLVGGHCIGVDPYYLTYKAESLGYHPQVILAGRRINDSMGEYIASQTVQRIVNRGGCQKGDKVVVLGLTFKENCPDIRNSKVVDVIRALRAYGLEVVVHDPLVDPAHASQEYGLALVEWDKLPRNAAAVVVAVPHTYYLRTPLEDIISILRPGGVFTDVKAAFSREIIEAGGFELWRL